MKEKYWHELFEVSIFIKGLNGLWQTITGALLFFLSHVSLDNIFLKVVHHELLQDPQDRFVNFLWGQLQHFSVAMQTFTAFYIIFHGFLNLFLSISLYYEKLWAYKVSLTAVTIIGLYQLYRFNHTHSPILLLLTIFDLFYLVLTWHEYQYHYHKRSNNSLSPL